MNGETGRYVYVRGSAMTHNRTVGGLRLGWLLLAVTCTISFAEVSPPTNQVVQTQIETDRLTNLKILVGQIHLPLDGQWHYSRGDELPPQISHFQVVPSEHAMERQAGQRMRQIAKEQRLAVHSRALRSMFWFANRHARKHNGVGPASMLDLDADATAWFTREYEDKLHLIPSVRIFDTVKTNEYSKTVSILGFELQPEIDDGRFWVVRSNGRTERIKIDRKLARREKVKIAPKAQPPSGTATVLYHAVALQKGERAPLSLPLRDHQTGRKLTVDWDLRTAQPGKNLASRWAQQQAVELMPFSPLQIENGALGLWIQTLGERFGVQKFLQNIRWQTRQRARNQRRSESLLNVLGGRTAIRETLQLDAIDQPDEGPNIDDKVRLAIDQVPGVLVESHPFGEMLAGRKKQALDLANYAPIDRLFLYAAKPQVLLSLIDKGVPFLHGASVQVTRQQLQYDIVGRTLRRLGLTEEWVRSFLSGGAISEAALLTPDLFFIDGTDVTVLCRLANPQISGLALRALGVKPGEKLTELKLDSGESTWWWQTDDLLVISTLRSEIEHVQRSARTPQSLGLSDEFGYMLTQLPVLKSTLAYAYFSDPFIRRLVGPEVKIGQLRRLRARAELEKIGADALFHQYLTGHASSELAALTESTWVQKPRWVKDVVLDETLAASSPTWGHPGDMRTLSEAPVRLATPGEIEMYERYRDNYSRYWSRFFDPIAIRFDKRKNQLELSTFILPLIDNSLYEGLRERLVHESDAVPLQLPNCEPTPVAMMSINLNEKAWLNTIRDVLDDWFLQNMGLQFSLVDHLGPDLHVIIADADPILSVGSGEFTQLFGRLGRGFEMAEVGMVLSMLTRPAHLAIGLDDPEAVMNKLRRIPTLPHQLKYGIGETSVYRHAGKDQWIIEINIENLINLRFGVSVQDRYLVLSNLPLTRPLKIAGSGRAEHNAALITLHPGACLEQLPALRESAMRIKREAALRGMDRLLPFLLCGAESVEAAGIRHRNLFGFLPAHPDGGEYIWENGELKSSQFGSIAFQEQPAPDAMGKNDFGALGGIDSLQVGCQFELDGLRATASWQLKEGGKDR